MEVKDPRDLCGNTDKLHRAAITDRVNRNAADLRLRNAQLEIEVESLQSINRQLEIKIARLEDKLRQLSHPSIDLMA